MRLRTIYSFTHILSLFFGLVQYLGVWQESLLPEVHVREWPHAQDFLLL